MDGRQGALDLTADNFSVCEIHGGEMVPKSVGLGFRMKRRRSEKDRARPTTFPHADEPYDTGWCIPPRELFAKVFVCAACTEVKNSWLAKNDPGSNFQKAQTSFRN